MLIKKYFIKTFFNPKLCNKIDFVKYPWGWKSQNDIQNIIEYPISNHCISFSHDRKFIHEYRLNELTEEIYKKTYFSYLNNCDFLNLSIFSPKLANGLNYLRLHSNKRNLDLDVKINKISLIGNWVKYGRVKNKNKILGLYNDNEFIHEISAGMIGPEIQAIWDQQSVKQKVRLLIELENRKDVFDFERDLMIHNDNWQLSNINRIII